MSQTNIKGCIFDLDGVLVDTAKYHFKSWIKLSDKLGFKLDAAVEESLKGISRMDSLDIVLKAGGLTKSPEEKKALAKLKNDWYLESLENLDDSVVLPGVKPFIKSLKDAGLRIAVGSASKNATTILTKLDMAKDFISIIDGNLVKHTKPDPEVFINAARDIQLPESQCIVFEDSQKGIQAALSGGFSCVGIGHPSVLTKAHLVIPGFDNISFVEILSKLEKQGD